MKGRRADSHKYQFRRKAYYDMKEEGTLEEYERFWKKKVKDDKREIKKMVKRGASEKEIEARKWEGKTKLGPMAHAKGVFLRIVKMIQGPANFAKPIPNTKAAETSDRFSWVGDSWPPPRDPRVAGKGNW